MLQQPHDADPPCEVCGLFPEDCICPSCLTCKTQGNPDCYLAEWQGGHGLTITPAQQIEKQKFRVAESLAQYKEECMILDYLEEQWNRQGD